MLQEPTSVRFLHVAMLQHDPEGRIAFMHRTAEGKFFPNRCSARAHTSPNRLMQVISFKFGKLSCLFMKCAPFLRMTYSCASLCSACMVCWIHHLSAVFGLQRCL